MYHWANRSRSDFFYQYPVNCGILRIYNAGNNCSSERKRGLRVSQQRSEKVALITGANKGIGFETARQLGEQGITVLVGSRDQHRGEQAASALQAKGVKARALVID